MTEKSHSSYSCLNASALRFYHLAPIGKKTWGTSATKEINKRACSITEGIYY